MSPLAVCLLWLSATSVLYELCNQGKARLSNGFKLSVCSEEKNKRHCLDDAVAELDSRERPAVNIVRPSPAGSSRGPLSSPTHLLVLPMHVPTMQSDHAVWHWRSSTVGFINACREPLANAETGLQMTLICLLGHDGTIFFPPPSSRHFLPTPSSPQALLLSHTLYPRFVVYAVCLCVIACSSTITF